MLYELYDLQRSFMRPVSAWAASTAQLYTNPYSPLSYSPMSRRIAATLELTHRLGKEYEKPEWRISAVETPFGTASVQEKLALEKPFCHLIHFEKHYAEHKHADPGPKLLVVAPLSGHHATLLRDTIRTLLSDHDVWVTDWVDARMVPVDDGSFNLADYVHYVEEFIRFLSPNINVLSVCQPTVPVMGAVSLMAARGEAAQPDSIIMMGGPIDTRVGETKVNDLAKEHDIGWFQRNLIHIVPSRFPGFMRKVYPGFLQYTGFVAMNPSRHANSHLDFFMHLLKGDDDAKVEAHKEFYDEYNAVLDLAGEFYLDTIKTVFQDHALPQGKWRVNGELVKPQSIRQTALLTIEGELDDISGRGQTEAAQDLCSGIPAARKRHALIEGAGHYGIFSGKRWRSIVAPMIRDFILEHAPTQAKPSSRAPRASRSKSS